MKTIWYRYDKDRWWINQKWQKDQIYRGQLIKDRWLIDPKVRKVDDILRSMTN